MVGVPKALSVQWVKFFSKNMVNLLTDKRSVAIPILILTVAALFGIPLGLADAYGSSSTGTVCIAPQGSGSCPTGTVFTGSTGGSLTVGVDLQNSATLNGFDVFVKTDNSILAPVGAGISGIGGAIQGGGSITIVCINGTRVTGTATSCSPQDGPGIVHVAIVGTKIRGPVTGLLFTVSYRISGQTFGSTIGFQSGCTPSSVAGTTTCVNITDGRKTDPENVVTAAFRNSPAGLVCLAATSSSCPSAPPTFSGAVNSQLTVDVTIQASDAFNAFDIRVQADPTILNGAAISLTGSVLSSPVFTAVCINGFFMGGSCQSSPGTDEAIVSTSSSTTAPTTGLLFSITYNIVGTTTGTMISYPTGCSSSSVSGTTTCVAINNAGAVVPETVQTASFSN